MTLPDSFGRYRPLRELGRGAFSTVYEAEDTSLGRRVAVKILADADGAALERFDREARISATLEHESIVRIIDVGAEGGRRYLTMPLLPGGDLLTWARREKPGYRDAARVLERVARAVHFAHEHQVIHRDLKPSNILMDDSGRPVVTDFGIARRLDSTSRLTWTGEILGTPLYMSPEQLRGDHDAVDARSDVYALGVILYELVSGDVPYDAPTFAALVQRVQREEPPRLSTRAADVPRDLEVLCHKALSREKSDRYASAAELADDLARFAAGFRIAARPPGLVRRARTFLRRHRVRAALLAMAAVAGLVVWRVTARAQDTTRADLDHAVAVLDEGRFEEAAILLDRLKAERASLLSRADQLRLDSAWERAIGRATLTITTTGRLLLTDLKDRRVEPGALFRGRYRVRVEWDDPRAVTFDFWIRLDRGERWTILLPRVTHVPDGMVFVPGVDFLFGESRERRTCKPFFIDEREVRVGDFLNAAATALSKKDVDALKQYPDRPMVAVSKPDAESFAARLKKRLPTEEEWELAARGLDGRRYPWGEDDDPALTVCGEGKKRETPLEKTPVTDRSVWGVRDLAGNVMEWTSSKDAVGAHIVRGGAYFTRLDECRTYRRYSVEADFRDWALGFRCAADFVEAP